jgi:hypothetical protein
MFSRPFGFDMEWKVIFRTGGRRSFRTALVQLSDDKIILLAQLSTMKSKLYTKIRISVFTVLIRVSTRTEGMSKSNF